MRQHPQQSPVTGAFLAHLLQQKEVTVPDDLRSMPLWFVDPATHFRVSQVLAIRQRGSTEEYLVEWVDNDAAVDAEDDEQLHSNDPPPTVAPTVALSDQYQTWEPFVNIPGTAALINTCREAIAEANLIREQETQKKKQAARDRRDEEDARQAGLVGGKHKGKGSTSRPRVAQATAESSNAQGTQLDVNCERLPLSLGSK
jgi:hypothetical protein